MPDIDFQKIVLNLIPKKGDEPVIFYASQYETARPFIADLFWGDTEFAPGVDCYAEIDIRKNDNNLVVITDDVAIDNNEVSVILPVQALTCIGKNLGQVKIYGADDHLIAALNFLLEVQPDPLAGGVDSETAIDNLETQIEEIAEEVIGENYYDKTEVDSLLADKADVSDLPDMTQYYTKTQTDTLLNGKADAANTYTKSEVNTALAAKADASTTYTKTEVDNALALKANTEDLATVATTGDYDDLINKPTIPAAQIQSDYEQADNTKVDYIKNKPDIAGMISAAIDSILPVVADSGAIASINVGVERLLKTITVDPLATTVYRSGNNLWDGVTESGYIYNGNEYPSTSYWRIKNYIPIAPNTEYYFRASANDGQINWYDINKTFISAEGSMGGVDRVATSPVNAYYVRFYQPNTSDPTDTCVNYPSTVTTYSTYEGETYPVADIDQITTLNGVNNIYADAGDVSVSAYDSIQHYIDNQ